MGTQHAGDMNTDMAFMKAIIELCSCFVSAHLNDIWVGHADGHARTLKAFDNARQEGQEDALLTNID